LFSLPPLLDNLRETPDSRLDEVLLGDQQLGDGLLGNLYETPPCWLGDGLLGDGLLHNQLLDDRLFSRLVDLGIGRLRIALLLVPGSEMLVKFIIRREGGTVNSASESLVSTVVGVDVLE
jgi:hypothetical protein